MKRFREFLDEKINWQIPNEPGTTPIPKDHIRLYHQTNEKNLGSIKKRGIRLSYAKGIEGPKAVYADERGFYGKPSEKPTVEFSVHKNRFDHPFVKDGVNPKDIIAVHKPWHQHARYAENNPEVIKNITQGEHDALLHDKQYGKSIRYIKHKYGKKR